MSTGENTMIKTQAQAINGTGSGMQTAQATRRIKDVGQRLIAGLRAGLMAFALMAGLPGVHAQAWAAVSLTAPAANSNYLQWSNVTLAADATAPGGTISRVDFYANNGTSNTLIGTSGYPPYNLIWNAGVGGHYAMTAVATDNLGTQTASQALSISVVTPPTVNLTSPASNAAVASPASFTLSADASSLGSIAKVEFYSGGTLLNTATSAPYSYSWNNVAAGYYTLSAKATDTLGQSTTSNFVNVISATPPVVSLTSPAANTVSPAPGSFTLTANAWGTSSGLKSVSFYNGTTLLGTATNAPYTFTWNNVAAGSYSLTAIATDNNNVTATSGAVAVTVAANQPPTVTLTSPAANSNYIQWSNVTLSANATSPIGSIAKVDFYANNGTSNTLIGTSGYPPYSLIWNAGVGGHYAMTAVATDNLGAQTASQALSISVVTPPTVNLTSPANNAAVASPASFTLSADAGSLGTIANVEFYGNGALLGTATAAPYSYVWNNVAAGFYTLSAKATDTLGQSTTSNFVNVISATPPVVSLTSPAANTVSPAPGSFTLTANAWGTSSGLKSVSFYSGATLLGTATNAPYTFTWNNVAAGSYGLTAIATDNNNVTASSGAVAVTVAANQPPTVTLTSPAANSNYIQWSNVTLSANAASPIGSIARVDFYANNGTANTLIGTSGYPPYNLIWNAGVGGHYTMTAVATDNLGTQTASQALSISVVTPPTVNLTSPVGNAAVASPASFTLSADASSLGTIAKVEFYSGGTLLGTTTSAPYSYTWSNVPAGYYALMAKATDTLGQSSYSSAVNVTSATPPVVSLTSPAANTVSPAPGSFTLTANAWGTSSGLKSVSFYSGATLLGTATNAPYTFTWNNVAAGSYSLTAIATDNNNVTATSGAVNVTVAGGNQPPTVTLTSPAANSNYIQWSNVTLSANATSPIGSIARVDFYANNGTSNTLIGTSGYPPYNLIWNAGVGGHYAMTAVATDNLGAQTASAVTAITVVVPPTVNITGPANNAAVSAPGSFTITATATNTNNSIAKVEFYNGTMLLGTATTAPYRYSWNNVAAGSYSLTAIATDNNNVTATSGAVNVTVAGTNQPPAVSLTSPLTNSTTTAPGSFTLTANATSTGSTIARVDFYQGATLIGTATAAPYSFNWTNIPVGSYNLTAKATDLLNVTTSSSPVGVTVNAASVQAYYIHADQLDTPRVITDTAGNTVWQWDNVDPFGNNMANENPTGAGVFSFNLRFPGQYFDRETNLNYNINRDYDAAIGRYIQSDPIGLMGGVNTYAYVRGNPLSYVDPYGLRDVDVYIWRAEGLSVGHVMVTEANSTQVILSQFPSNGYPRGPNETKSFADTMAAEGRAASEIWRINVPNDQAFDASAARERGLKRWSWNPSNDSTQCSIAASRALKAGGVGLNTIATGTLMPGFFANGLQATPGIGNKLP